MGIARTGTTESTFDFLPDDLNYDSLKAASSECRGCDLYKDATQTVFGEGDVSSGVIFVGEQPGDEEDLKGRPFVGPAGRLFVTEPLKKPVSTAERST